MDWKGEAVTMLTQYGESRGAVESIQAEIRALELESEALKSTTLDVVHIHGDRDRREDALLTNIVRREELARRLELVQEWNGIVERGLSSLNERDAMVLDRFYLHPQSGAAGRLCEELDLAEESSVFRIRRKALRRFTQALYGPASADALEPF